MPTTDVYWDVNGVSLQELAWNISTLGGARRALPGWRGSDRKYAYRAGAAPRRMVADSRTITLAMWCTGWRNDDVPTAYMDRRYEDNRKTLERLFWRPGGSLVTLTKRWKDLNGNVLAATGTARLVSDMSAEMQGPYKGKFTVDLFMPDPWFYGPQQGVEIGRGETVTIDNPGDDACTHMTVGFEGELHDPVVTNLTPDTNVVLRLLNADIGVGTSWTVDVDDCTVVRNSDGANMIGKLSHSGARSWMRLGRNESQLQLTASGSGSGHALVRYSPAYF
jgi:hypothetical protein